MSDLNLEVWIPVILALIAFADSILSRRAKTAAKSDAAKKGQALQVAVDAIEESDDQKAKDTVSLNTREIPELHALIQEFKKLAEAKRAKSDG